VSKLNTGINSNYERHNYDFLLAYFFCSLSEDWYYELDTKLAVLACASSCSRFRVKTKTIKLINSLNQNPSSEAKLMI
jgi:hypothetical protein